MTTTGIALVRSGVLAVVAGVLVACSGKPRTPLEGAAASLGIAEVTALQFSGTGKWFQFGQSPAPGLPWPAFDVGRYDAVVDYAGPAARVRITRTQVVEPGRERPAPTEQSVDQLVSGAVAWNVPASGPPAAQPAAVAERLTEIWTTPQGFVRAAMANQATAKPVEGGTQVSFTLGAQKYEGLIDANYHLVRVRTMIDNPVLGDTPVEVQYGDYQPFGKLAFPTRITRMQGGHPVLELAVSSVAPATSGVPAVPREVGDGMGPRVEVSAETLAPGVHYLKGGSHHSLAIEQQEGIVVVEAPQHEERSRAVIAKVKELIPNKPIKYLVNTHHHFDHSGGLRTYVAEGATIVTHEANKPFYEQAWSTPRTLNPDRLSDAGCVTDLPDLHRQAGAGRSGASGSKCTCSQAMATTTPSRWSGCRRKKILSEGDAWTPPAPGAANSSPPSPCAVNLTKNIERLKLDVKTIAALHGPGVATMAEAEGGRRNLKWKGPRVSRRPRGLGLVAQ